MKTNYTEKDPCFVKSSVSVHQITWLLQIFCDWMCGCVLHRNVYYIQNPNITLKIIFHYAQVLWRVGRSGWYSTAWSLPSVIRYMTLSMDAGLHSEIKTRMAQKKLKLHDDKTGCLPMKSRKMLPLDHVPVSIQVGNATVLLSSCGGKLGHVVSSEMSLDKHITKLCSSLFRNTKDFSMNF